MIENQKIRPAQVIGPLGEPLTLEALPLVMGLTWLARRHPSRLPIEHVRRAVFVLLLIAGLALVLPPVLSLLA